MINGIRDVVDRSDQSRLSAYKGALSANSATLYSETAWRCDGGKSKDTALELICRSDGGCDQHGDKLWTAVLALMGNRRVSNTVPIQQFYDELVTCWVSGLNQL